MTENRLKFEQKPIVCCEEGHEVLLLTAVIAAFDQCSHVLLLLLLIHAMRGQFRATASVFKALGH